MQTFVNELLIRLFSDKPHFFKIIQLIGVLAAMVTGIPALLLEYDFVLPEAFQVIANQTMAVASMVAAFVAQLTVTAKTKKKQGLED